MSLLTKWRSRWPRAKATIHLHALCWNEEKMLPYFFRHYDALVSRYFIYDNGSQDKSLELLRQHPKVTLERFDVTGDSFVAAAMAHYNQCWKQSRGEADWVIVCNVDEHFYYTDWLGRDLAEYLAKCKKRGITQIIPDGYNMVSETFPASELPLYQTVRYGMRDPFWDKPQLFDPNQIAEINFEPGRHTANPTGRVRRPEKPQVKMLHFKYIGYEYLIRRHNELRAGLKPLDIQNDWGNQYLWDEARNREELQRMLDNAVRVL